MTHAGRVPSTTQRPDLPVAQARWFRVLADPTRLAIVKYLLDGPHSVTELVEKTGVPQSRISNHLACLRWCQFVNAERQGRRVVYTITDARVGHVLDIASDLVTDVAEHLASCRRIGPDWM